MKLLPKGVTELDPNLRWVIAKQLQIIKEIVVGPEVSESRTPTMEEGWRRMGQAVVRQDKKAEETALGDYMRADMREWWQDFPEQRLLRDLYRRAALRQANSGSRDSGRTPSHDEGRRIAKALLVDLQDTRPLDVRGEADTVARALAGEGLVTFSFLTPAALLTYITESETSPTHFDALSYLCAKWDDRGWDLPPQLARWRQEVAEGGRWRPAVTPIPAHRPLHPDRLRRDMHLQFTIEILDRVGVHPQGSLVSGCQIVAEASGLPEARVVRIWKACTWRRSFEPEVRRQSIAIASRHGPFPLPKA